MRTRVILQMLSLLLLTYSSEALFFDPKKAVMEFFQSLKSKKFQHEVHHYHLHYYPSPVQVITEKPAKAPDKHELNYLHDHQLRTLGWNEHEYKHVPEPEVTLHESHNDPWIDQGNRYHHEESWTWDDGSDLHQQVAQHHSPPIAVHIPFHQQIILQHPAPPEEKKKQNPIVAFFEKLHRVKDAIFGQEAKQEEHYKDERPVIANKLSAMNAYVVYLHPKSLRTF